HRSGHKFFVVAAEDATVVTVDNDRDGNADLTYNLDSSDTSEISVSYKARLSSNKPIQIVRISAGGWYGAGVDATYEAINVVGKIALVELGLPESCQDIRDTDSTASDGEYTIYPNGNTQVFDVYCNDMAGTPSEYLKLMKTGDSYNFAQYTAGGASPGTSVKTSYQMIRLDPATLMVDIGDQTFATSTSFLYHSSVTRGNIYPVNSMPYGIAYDCKSSLSKTGVANIDLSGTPFAVIDTFSLSGHNPAGRSIFSQDNQIVNLNGGGYCGGITPSPGMSIPFNTEGGFRLDLEYIGPTTLDGFTFAHLTDVHIGYNSNSNGMKESVEQFSDTLQSVKKHDPDFMLVTGDLVEYNSPAYFQAYTGILESIEIPVYNTPGNHDRRNWAHQVNNLDNYQTYIENGNSNYPIIPLGNFNDYYFDWGGYRFIGLDSGADYNTSVTIAGYDKTPESEGLKEAQLTKLNEIASEKPKIIFMHHPSLSDINDVQHWNSFEPPVTNNCQFEYFGNDGSIAFFRCNFIEYSVNNNVDLVLTGHIHKDSFTIIPNEDETHETWFIQTRSATKDEDSFNHGYRVITIDNGIVTRNETETTSSLPKYVYTLDASTLLHGSIFGISAFDQYGGHTGMDIYGNVDRDIPESYYTGIYDGGFPSVPQVLVLYNEPESVSFHSDMMSTIPAKSNIFQTSLVSTQSTEEMYFNITISHQT
ncbi:MAG: metallophosphoesterase, partial [Thermoplasmata archaeon]|nr:metallophosphoesterase [Thermoplasmata archaeon]